MLLSELGGRWFTKKTRSNKSRDTVPLKGEARRFLENMQLLAVVLWTNLEPVANGAVNFLGFRIISFINGKSCYELSALLKIARKMPSAALWPVRIHNILSIPRVRPALLICYAQLAIRNLIANSCMRWRGIFKGLSQDGGLADFSKNLCASSFNKDLLNDITFSQIHVAGQYL